MKIAFWSNIHGQTGTTSNLLAVAVMITLQYRLKCMIAQTHFNMNNLEASLIHNTNRNYKEFFMDIGIDALLRSIKNEPLDCEIIENSSISIWNKQINLLPGTLKNNREIYETDMNHTFTGILSSIANYYDIVFIDTNSGNNPLSAKILKDADVIIVNLSQNRTILEDYARNNEIHKKNIFYLIGNYDASSRYNLKNLLRSYKWLNHKNTAVIPYNTEYMDAQSDGEVIHFLLRNMNCEKEECNSYFIREVKKAILKIMSLAGIERCEFNELYS